MKDHSLLDVIEMHMEKVIPSARCNDQVLDHRMVAAHSIATAAVIQQLMVLFQVEHVVH